MEARENEHVSSPLRRATTCREDGPEHHRARSSSASRSHRRERQKPSPDSLASFKRMRRDRETPSRGSESSSGRETTPSRNHHGGGSTPERPPPTMDSALAMAMTMTERFGRRESPGRHHGRRNGNTTPRNSPPQQPPPSQARERGDARDARDAREESQREDAAPSSSSVADPETGAETSDSDAQPHPLGYYGQISVQQAMDMSAQQPSIIVGTPNASVSIGAGDYSSPVVLVNGSEATVLDTSGECMREICDNLTKYTNSIDFATQDSRFQTNASPRRHINSYRGRLLTIVCQYNQLVPDELRARYHKGGIHFSTTVMASPFHLPDGTLHNWATMLTPRATGIPGGFFLLTSLKGNAAVCQPFITRGGTRAALVTYPSASSAPPPKKIVKLDLTCMFFTPFRIPEFGVRMIALDDPMFRAGGIAFGIMSPVKRTGATTVALFSGLTWCIRTAIGEHGQMITTYAAWFECTQDNAYGTCKFWRPGPPAVYECGEHEVTITVENMYVIHGGRKLIGTLAVRSDYFTAPSLRTEMMPSMLVLRFELYGVRHREPEIMFATNPTCHLAWPLGESEHEIHVYSPYDVQFKGGRHHFSLDLRYFKPQHRRCFLVSVPQDETRFHTAMTVWRPDAPLRLTLVSHLPNLQLHRGTQVATLYLIHTTEGDVYQVNEQAALKLIKCNDATNLYAGDLRLPRDNFAFYDEL
nr:protein UL31 [Murid betaherpesvirus 2]